MSASTAIASVNADCRDVMQNCGERGEKKRNETNPGMAKATKFVLLLLLALTVLAPVVFYTDRVSTNADQRQDFDRDVGNAERAIENDKLNALRQEILSSMKERVRHVVSEKSGQVAKSLIKSGNKGSATTKVRKHRNRGVLSHTTAAGGPGSKDEGLLRRVTSQKTQDGGSVMVSSDEQEKAAGSHRHSSPEGSKLEFVPKLVVEKSQAEDRNSKSNGTALPDARVRYIRDQLIKGRVYLGIGVLQTNRNYHRDLRQRIRVVQRVLGDSSKDSDLPSNANEKVKALEQALAKGQHIQDDSSIAIRRLRAMLHLVDQQLRAHKKQSVFLTQLAAKTLSKGLHCLPLRLTSEYFSLDPGQQQFPNQERLEDPKLYHYALFSDNILAAAVVVNSTVSNAKHPSDHVFHIVTDRLNYAPMRMWFLSSPPRNATIEVRNIEEFTWLNASYSPVLKQLGSRSMVDYYFRTKHAKSDGLLKYRNPKYISILNHLRFYLPELYPKLNKVVFLDDDIIVKKDLASLWSIDLKGKVNGAVETCGESFHHFNCYLNFSNPVIAKNFDPHACGWAFGMNVFDLAEWRRQNITKIYHSWQKLNRNRLLWKLGTLPPGLITFWNRTFPLDRSWHVLGLGYNPHVSSKEIEKAAVIHYNGNMKPWLEIGMPKYRKHWSKYVDYDQVYLHECNINP